MAKKSGEEAFSSAQTPEQLALALQKRLASGELTTGETRAVELIAQLRGWTVDKKSSAPAAELPAAAKPVPIEEPHW